MATADGEEDSDVLWRGSPLYSHLHETSKDLLEDASVEERFSDTPSLTPASPQDDTSEISDALVSKNPFEASRLSADDESALLSSAKSFMWPKEDPLVLEVRLAQAVLESELLVQEDEEFLHNFILNEEILTEYNRLIEDKPSPMSSLLSDVVLFSGSVAAVAGAVLYLSEKAKAATAAAALLPTALAAMTSVRIGNKVSEDQDSEHFHQIVELLLSDMKRFKQLVRKSLNLLQGMEVITQGNFLSVDPATGASMVSTSSATSSTSTSSPSSATTAAQALAHRTDFPALRRSALKCTLQIIEAYREAIDQLLKVSPLADHVDMREHYLAFVDLNTFGLPSLEASDAASTSDDKEGSPPIAIRELKETAQIALVQQSEYLRRFSLAFCDRVREDNNVLNKAGVLKHIRDLLVTIRKINGKLSRVLEYHQAMGFDVDKLEKPKCTALVEKTSSASGGMPSASATRKFVPLRSIYTSMFSTGLHLQNTLLKLRRLEEVFENFEKSNKRSPGSGRGRRGRTSPPIPVDEVKLIEWLGSFQEIQTELNACIGCLDDGVSQIGSLREDENPPNPSAASDLLTRQSIETNGTSMVHDEDLISPTFDEVFEAIIAESDRTTDKDNSLLDSDVSPQMQRQSHRLLKELKGVLFHKAKEHEIREAKAIARQNGEEDPFLLIKEKEKEAEKETNGLTCPLRSNGFDDAFMKKDDSSSPSTSSSSSVVSDCPTVRSASPRKIDPQGLPRSISGQSLGSDQDEAGASKVTSHSEDNHSLAAPKSVGSLRSRSTPDLNSMNPMTTSYRAFAGSKDDSDHQTASSSSSGWESADELDIHHLPTNLQHKRPLRPAAIASAEVTVDPVVVKDTNVSHEKRTDQRRKRLRQKRERNRSNLGSNDGSRSKPLSTYMRLNGQDDVPLSIPDQRPTGFDGSLASQVAGIALSMRNGHGNNGFSRNFMCEEVIGASSSSSSNDESS